MHTLGCWKYSHWNKHYWLGHPVLTWNIFREQTRWAVWTAVVFGAERSFSQQRLSWNISHVVVSSPPTPSPLQVDRLLLRKVSCGHRLCCRVISLAFLSSVVYTDIGHVPKPYLSFPFMAAKIKPETCSQDIALNYSDRAQITCPECQSGESKKTAWEVHW